MATYTTIPTFTAGQVLTSSVMNDVKNNLDLGNAQSAYPYRNLLYNGQMAVAQRGSSVPSITTPGYFTADRWDCQVNALGTWTQSVDADGPSGTPIKKSLKMLATTADASPAAGDYIFVRQLLEGYDVQRIMKGTASATTLTLTFWVKSNAPGTYIVELEDQDNARSISRSYTISVSGTWEQKSITFSADSTGAFDNDANGSLGVNFWLASGTTFSSGSLQTSWGTRTNANRNVGGTNVAAAINNYWQVTGVQLEVGSVSTPFEVLPYGDELARCQRYAQVIVSGDAAYVGTGQTLANAGYIVCVLNQEMRAAPSTLSLSSVGHFSLWDTGTVARTCTALTIGYAGKSRLRLDATVASGISSGAVTLLTTNNASASMIVSAEL